jgi:hypothetical protein
MAETMGRDRNFFAAMTSAFNIRICEELADGSLRAVLWSKLTKAERQRGKQFVNQLAPDTATLASAGACAWKSANDPKTEEVAKALEEFVAAMERHHGAKIWTR